MQLYMYDHFQSIHVLITMMIMSSLIHSPNQQLLSYGTTVIDIVWLYSTLRMTTNSTVKPLTSCTLDNIIVENSDVVGASSALLKLHLSHPLNTWLKWIGQRKLQDKMINI